MIAELQAFYGGDPMRWASMPTGWLRAFEVMLPRLRARERLRRIVDMQLAFGASGADARAVLAAIERDADLPAQPRAPTSYTDLAALGVRVMEE